MKRYYVLTILIALANIFCLAQSQYVNPLVGTAEHGHTFPGAIVPFGGVQASPDTRLDGWDGCSGYHYSDNTIYGFSHTHLSGTGCSDYGDVLIMPFTGKPSVHNSEYAAMFSHENETAKAGYYAVKLDNGILVELTAGRHTAAHRYTFPKKGPRGIIIDLTHRDKVLASGITHRDNEFFGFRRSEAWNPDQYCAFSIRPSEPVQKVEYFYDDSLVSDHDVRGTNCKAILYFDEHVKTVTIKVGISAVDIAGAMNNQKEIEQLNFDQVKANAIAAWDKELGKIQVESSNPEHLKVFYTALYHCFTSPYLHSDANGSYRGQDGKIHHGDGTHEVYTVFSLWDTYRALHPLLSLIDRKRTEDFISTFMLHYKQGGMLPVWELSSHETWCMIGYHSVPVILDAYIKGIHPYDANEMLEAMVHSAKLNKLGRPEFAQYGYIPGDVDNESVSKTLEYAYDDWCISEFSEKIGNLDVSNEFFKRSKAYRNILDPNGFMHAKINGGFVTPFDPTEVNNFYTEANSWQYSTYVPHDIDGYIYEMGGKKRVETFLDNLFNSSSKMTGREQSDITGVIGQYAHGNEPSHHAAYLYNYVNRYDKTVDVTRKIMSELYTSRPDGLCGNEDCGQMSAWYIFSSLGFYPICPGNNAYTLGYPMFNKATINLENGKRIIIRKEGKGNTVANVTINGKQPNSRMEFFYDDIKDGGEIVFSMTEKELLSYHPNEQTGSIINIPTPPVPYFSTDKKSFSEPMQVEIKNYRPANITLAAHDVDTWAETSIYYTTDGSTPAPTHGTLYTQPINVDHDITIKAMAYNKTSGSSEIAEASYIRFNKDKVLEYITEPNPQYYAGGNDGLIDGIRGKTNWRVGNWQGFHNDFEAVIDLQQKKKVNEIALGCLEDVKAWIFYPLKIEIFISDDNSNFTLFGTANGIGSEKSEEAKTHEFKVNGNASGRYLKIKVSNYGELPEWHVSAGQQAWLFLDEVEVK